MVCAGAWDCMNLHPKSSALPGSYSALWPHSFSYWNTWSFDSEFHQRDTGRCLENVASWACSLTLWPCLHKGHTPASLQHQERMTHQAALVLSCSLWGQQKLPSSVTVGNRARTNDSLDFERVYYLALLTQNLIEKGLTQNISGSSPSLL